MDRDSEAAGFIVSEQWTMMTDTNRQLDAFLTYLLDGRAALRRTRPRHRVQGPNPHPPQQVVSAVTGGNVDLLA